MQANFYLAAASKTQGAENVLFSGPCVWLIGKPYGHFANKYTGGWMDGWIYYDVTFVTIQKLGLWGKRLNVSRIIQLNLSLVGP